MGGQTSVVLRHQELGIANAPFGKKLLNSYMGNICSILVVYDIVHSGNEAEFGSEIWIFLLNPYLTWKTEFCVFTNIRESRI